MLIDELDKIQKKIYNKIKLDLYDNYNLIKSDYEVNDIIVVNEHNNIIEYYISVCLIYAFILEKNKVNIANQYMVKI
jgi:hypothetical protein